MLRADVSSRLVGTWPSQLSTGQAESMTQERLIKKYANRRLYDATQSRHITLDDIRTLIVKGEKIRVVEDKTGHDITRHILLQVIAEQEQFGRPILSTPVLEAIIRFYGNALQGFLAGFLEKSVETFLSQQEAVQSQITKIVANTPLATVADMTRQNLESLAKIQESMLGALLAKRDKGRDEDDSKESPARPASGRSGPRNRQDP
jgi:polyhydroxyalkanoate synthesis repressor PhaR